MPEAPTLPDATISLHYIKSSHFRVIFAEGAYGGVTPRGHIAFALYNERQAIPRETAIDFKDEALGPERVVDGRNGIVREVETEIIMDATAAINFHSWLGNHIEKLKALSEAEI